MPHPPEQWRPIVGYDGLYEVSSHGQVRSLKYGKLRILKPQQSGTRRGYRALLLHGESVRRKLVHRLVMAAFVGPCPEGCQVNHKNGIQHDNGLPNLEYVTPKQNMEHASRVLWAKNGKPNVARKLTGEQVRELRRLAATGMTMHALGSMFGISGRTAFGIARRECYKHVT